MVADEPQSASGRASRSDTSRLEALSDGVIAVAITLLVLDLKVPHVEDESLWNALVTQWPSYFAYITSFLVIGILWVNHHSIFRQIRATTRGLMLINLVLLMLIVAIPFATSLVADYVTKPGVNATVAMATYSAVALAIALAIASLWGYALRHPALLEPEVDVEAARKAFPRFSIGSLVYLVLLVVSFVSPILALTGTFLVALYYSFEHLPKARATEA
ncbi:unannotated protein [freshwater metagenome]|uniref:Unannotated protein n=1 Tax=freshwater metagenome TaxID=449393 RepID=A0A6J7IMU2_9ZZZZ